MTSPDSKRSSGRAFGLGLGAVFLIAALLPLLHGHPMRMWALACGAVLALAALMAPIVLAPLSRLSASIGGAIHAVLNYFILAIFFYLLFTPMAWILGAIGKDFLRLRPMPEAGSYWIPRQPPGPEPQSMTNQF